MQLYPKSHEPEKGTEQGKHFSIRRPSPSHFLKLSNYAIWESVKVTAQMLDAFRTYKVMNDPKHTHTHTYRAHDTDDADTLAFAA